MSHFKDTTAYLPHLIWGKITAV